MKTKWFHGSLTATSAYGLQSSGKMYYTGVCACVYIWVLPKSIIIQTHSSCTSMQHHHISLLYTLWNRLKTLGISSDFSPHCYIMPSLFTVCGTDMVLCSQIQAWRLQGLSTTSISISCYIQASKRRYERVMELPWAGWNFLQLIEYQKICYKLLAPLLHNPFIEINDSGGSSVNRFEG